MMPPRHRPRIPERPDHAAPCLPVLALLLLATGAAPARAQPICQPDPTATGCVPTTCPQPGYICWPTKVIYNHATGQTTVLQCDCIPDSQCRLRLAAGAPPQCMGVCPNLSDLCQTVITPVSPVEDEYMCLCVPQPPTCAPDPAAQTCVGTCTGGTLSCVPTRIRYNNATGAYTVLACDCTTNCHPEIPATGGPPVCVNPCPTPGFTCTVVVTPVSPIENDYSCMCQPSYQNWVIADDFCLNPTCPPCTCDINQDGVCDQLDISFLAACFGSPAVGMCQSADLNCDGFVDNLDFSILNCLLTGGVNCCPIVTPPQPVVHRARWYGSYLDPDFEPPAGGGPPLRNVDGWLVALHRDAPAQPCPPPPPGYPPVDLCGTLSFGVQPGCILFTPDGGGLPYLVLGPTAPFAPPDHVRLCGWLDVNCITTCLQGFGCIIVQQALPCGTGVSRPTTLVAQWAFPPTVVAVQDAGLVGCDGHRTFSYVADLPTGCLIHNFGLPGEIDPTTGSFQPRPGVTYWISIQAEVGHVFQPLPPPLGCAAVSNGNVATQPFWGWHTTPPGYHNKDDAYMGMLFMGCHMEWLYGWMNHLHWSDPAYAPCADDPTKSIDMAFWLSQMTALGEVVLWYQPLNPGPPPPGPPPPPRPVPSGGIDTFAHTTAQVSVQFINPPIFAQASLSGPTTVLRGDPHPVGASIVIDTEMLQLDLTGFDPNIGQVILRESPTQHSLGSAASPAGNPFPMASFFDVFIEVDLPNIGLHLFSAGPVHVSNSGLFELPPSNVTFTGPPSPVTLLDVLTLQPIARLVQVDHFLPYRGGIDVHSDTDWANMPNKCACPGDMTGDGFVDGQDIQLWVKCYLTIFGVTPLNCPCLCADMNGDVVLNAADLPLFINRLLFSASTACP